jgi:hypothetical protein
VKGDSDKVNYDLESKRKQVFVWWTALMVDVAAVAQRIIDSEKKGRKLSKKAIYRLCGYDRGVMREVFRRIRLLRQEEQTLGDWLG